MSTEIELKLEVDPDDLRLVRQDPLLTSADSCSNQQVTVYYDTPATALKQHGFTLRVRSADGCFVQTMKPITDGVGLMFREEIECEVASLEPNLGSPAFKVIRDILPPDEADGLQEVIRSEVNRTTWQIDQRNGQMRIDLDHGTITAGGRSAEFAELEFEVLDGAPASLIVAARRLSDHVPVRLGVLTKAERGFLVAGGLLGKMSRAARVCVRPDSTVAQAFEVIVHACVKHYRLNEPVVIRKRKASALHQTRVAMRRLRSALALLRPAVGDVEFQHLRNELRWFTGQLGDARNLDVYLERELDPEERAQLMPKREQAYDDVAEAMNSHKFRRLLIDLVGWTALGAWRSGKMASGPIEGFARRRLDRLWRSIAAFGEPLDSMDETTRHELRIQVKKLRYAVEFMRGIYANADGREKLFGKALGELQESLGKLNDMATAKTLAGAASDDSWLIGSVDERRELIAADDALRAVFRVGPFWQLRRGESANLAL